MLLGIGETLHLNLQLKTESVRVEVLTFRREAWGSYNYSLTSYMRNLRLGKVSDLPKFI